MNYFALLALVLVLGGAYYSYTIQTARIAEVEQRLSEEAEQFKQLQADNEQLKAELADAQAKPKTAQSSATVAPVTPAPVAASANPFGTTAPVAPAASTSATPAATPATSPLAQGVVVIRGDNAEGTGFLVKLQDGPAVVTNLHVLSNNPHLKIQTSSGAELVVTGMKGATDRDLAMLSVQDGPYTFLPLATDVSSVAHPGDADTTPGNSQGGNVVLSTPGTVKGIGPDRVEFDNPIYHGNSGGPVIHGPSGTVIAVVTEAMKVDMTSDLDKTSFSSRNSAIASSIRYFGLRLDTVPKWEPYDLKQYQIETAFLDDFNKQSRALDAYLNPPKQNSGEASQTSSSDDANLYQRDDRIMAAHHNFRSQLSGSDTAQQIDALRQLSFALDSIADQGLSAIKSSNSFYTYDRQYATNALNYRLALKKEIQEFGSDVNRISDLPRSNN